MEMNSQIPSWDYNQLLKQGSFDNLLDSPGSWLFTALNLRTAADRIDWERNPIREAEPSLGLHSVYRMLIGMSIEALLKGILVAQGEQVLDNGKLSKNFATHDLTELVQRVDPSVLVFSSDESKILENLKPYIIWAGKYPIPKTANDLIAKGHSSIEIRLGRKLWDRLYEHLKNIGWVSKGSGKRLYFTAKPDRT